jgi:hypothetical protein
MLCCHEVRRAILDFNRKIGPTCTAKKAKLSAQMSKQAAMDLQDICCLFVYVEDQVLKHFGKGVMDQIRKLWLSGLRA